MKTAFNHKSQVHDSKSAQAKFTLLVVPNLLTLEYIFKTRKKHDVIEIIKRNCAYKSHRKWYTSFSKVKAVSLLSAAFSLTEVVKIVKCF